MTERILKAVRCVFGAAFLLCAAIAIAPLPTLDVAAAADLSTHAREPYAQGLLWRVEKPGRAASVLFGTLHLADKRVTTLPIPVRRELDAAQTFTMETALDSASIAALAGRMVYSDGRDLSMVAGAELFAKVAALLEARGLSLDAVKLFKPWAAMLLLVMPEQRADAVLDMVLKRIALRQGKPMHYLESIEDQIGVFENIPESDQVALLGQAVAIQRELPAATAKMVMAYLNRDLAAVWALSEESSARHPMLRELNEMLTRRLLNDRNALMAQRMQPQLERGRAFVAVGALHLYGEDGVLARLARSGYRVTRLY